MYVPIYRACAEAMIDDDERLAGLLAYRWCARRYRRRLTEYRPVRHYTDKGRRKCESLAQAVIRCLGEVIPPGHRVWTIDGPLDCRRANLVIAQKPPGGWSIPKVRPRRPNF